MQLCLVSRRDSSPATTSHLITMPFRQCTVEIKNDSGRYTLANPRLFIERGCCEVPLTPLVGPSSTGNAMFNKTTGCATGAVGVFTYNLFNADLNDYSHFMAVMYSVPYDRNIYSTWFAVGIFEREIHCDYYLYDMMYNRVEHNFVRAKADGSGISYEHDRAIVSASMSNSCQAVLRVDISDTGKY
ncbi:DELTA-stichotoxin-Hcr4b-like isoform X2 [Hippoglossus hippoglossus]|uniref:DELTA-stichotoxin-Hcr4b-like isoform X2 n=1 Tax=Hippoglossus hippoglossus TaxID=8267 RepID=UPI00148C6A1B|nr:DELTA-stichotoxin-Hcr4b-like isoform X2 [Hippoglossus hippoglossus]